MLAELLQAKELAVASESKGGRIALEWQSEGTRYGDRGHVDADAVAFTSGDTMDEAVQVYRARTDDLESAVNTALDKGIKQVGAAPARVRRVVMYLNGHSIDDVIAYESVIEKFVRRFGVVVEFIDADGRRARYALPTSGGGS